jgi:outer membrane protein
VLQSAAVIVFFLASVTYAADVARIGVVDYQKVLKESLAGKDIAKKMRKKQDEWTVAHEVKKLEIANLQKSIDHPEINGEKNGIDAQKKELAKKQEAFKADEAKYYGVLKDINAQQGGLIRDGIIQAIERVGKKGGYLLIVEKSDILYSPVSNDITRQVIDEYDSEYQRNK